MNEELGIKMKAAGTGVYTMQFTNTQSIMFGKIRGGSDDGKSIGGGSTFDATAKCFEKYATQVGGDMFYAKATKQ